MTPRSRQRVGGVESRRRIGELLDINPGTLRGWIERVEIDAGTRPGVTSEQNTELVRLRKENAELRRANEILKTASAFFTAAELDRTINDRCRCKSTATYCRSTLFLLARERVGFAASSFGLEPSRAGGEPSTGLGNTLRPVAPAGLSDTLAATTAPPRNQAAAEPSARPTQRERGKRSVIPSLICYLVGLTDGFIGAVCRRSQVLHSGLDGRAGRVMGGAGTSELSRWIMSGCQQLCSLGTRGGNARLTDGGGLLLDVPREQVEGERVARNSGRCS
jgi:transposase-like protein